MRLTLQVINLKITTLGDGNWKKLVAGSKFKEWPAFGTFKKSHIVLQNHGNMVWFKNIMIKNYDKIENLIADVFLIDLYILQLSEIIKNNFDKN